MVGPWPHPPGTLRALITILKGPFHVICRRCKRAAPMEVDRADLDRAYEPCPFTCSQCGDRAEIVCYVPADFAMTPMAARPPKPKTPDKAPPPPSGPWHRPTF